tara:strand:+ start:104866 stop:106290 length:1425 start_codon:yes stop_codon:yes gene_type:complete
MKKYIFCWSFLFCTFIFYAQEDKDLLPKSLSYFSTSNSFTSLGNFASLSTVDNTLNASFYFLSKNSSMYTVNVKGGATQGIATIFDEGELNSNASIGFEYRLLFSGKTDVYAGYNIPDILLIDEEIRKIEDDYNLKRLKLLERVNYLSKVIDSTDTTQFLNIGNDIIDNKLHPNDVKTIQKIDSILNRYDRMSLTEFNKEEKAVREMIPELKEYKIILEKRASTGGKQVYATEDNILIADKNAKINAAKKKKKDLKPRYIRLNFLSFGYKATNNNFVRFVDSLVLSKQLVKTNYTSHDLFLSYNFISNIKNLESQNKTIQNFDPSTYKFLTLGAEFSYTNNQSSLSQVEVIDTKYQNDGDSRVVNKTQKAFLGDYLEDLSSLNVFADYYSFFDKDSNFLAYHINPAMIFRENSKPVATVQFGLLIPFKKKEDNKSNVNVELFYKIKDIFNTTENDNSLLNRNIIGVQTAFPFNF